MDDTIAAILVAIDGAREPINVFNLGQDYAIVVNDSIAIITRTMGLTPKIEYAGGERGWVGDSPRILLDTARIRALGWKPSKTIEESVVETLSFLQDHQFTDRRS